MSNLIKTVKKEEHIKKLVKSAKDGNQDALKIILESMYDNLFRIALIKLHNEADAQDAVQETMLSIYKNLNALKEPKYFQTWAIKILINECNKIYIHRKNELNTIKKITDDYSDKQIDIENIDNNIYFSDLIKGLNEDEKIIMTLYFYGYKIKEIAMIQEINENTVKTKIKRCREKIKRNEKKEDYVHKTTKTVLISILLVIITTGLVYASIIIRNKINQQPEPIKWDTTYIKINASKETILNNMTKYDDNTYFYKINDYNKFIEANSLFNVTYENGDDISKDTFKKHEYELIFITFLEPKKVFVNNVLPNYNKLTIIFKDITLQKIPENINGFCIWVPKKYNRDILEIIFDTSKELDEMTFDQTAVKFKFSGFYIENLEEFYKLNLQYNDEKKYYSMEVEDITQYREIAETLGIETYTKVNLDELRGTKMILIFRENKKRIDLDIFNVKDNIPYISLKEVNEEYGKGITGFFIVFDEKFRNYNISIK